MAVPLGGEDAIDLGAFEEAVHQNDEGPPIMSRKTASGVSRICFIHEGLEPGRMERRPVL